MNCQYSQFLYTDTPVPRFSTQPYTVYSTPGLGNFFNDHILYTPVRYYEQNVKEMEKSIVSENSEGGFELNAPLIVEPLVAGPKKVIKKKVKKSKSTQKGHGRKSPTDPDIEDALQHPIKVFRNVK